MTSTPPQVYAPGFVHLTEAEAQSVVDLIDDMSRFVAKMSLQDYKAFADVPMMLRDRIKESSLMLIRAKTEEEWRDEGFTFDEIKAYSVLGLVLA